MNTQFTSDVIWFMKKEPVRISPLSNVLHSLLWIFLLIKIELKRVICTISTLNLVNKGTVCICIAIAIVITGNFWSNYTLLNEFNWAFQYWLLRNYAPNEMYTKPKNLSVQRKPQKCSWFVFWPMIYYNDLCYSFNNHVFMVSHNV